MIYETMNEYDIAARMKAHDRDNFSLETYRAYIEMMDDLGESQEFDAVAFDCSFAEYNLNDERDCQILIDEYGSGSEEIDDILEYLRDNSFVLLDDGQRFVFDCNF